MNRRTALWLAPLAVLYAAGCECSETPAARPGELSGTQARVDTGTIIGVVRLAAGESLPGWPESPTVAPPGRPELPPECTPSQAADRTPVTVASDSGGLRNLSVVVTGDDEGSWPQRPAEPALHEVHIRDCRLVPSTVVGTVGDRLRVVNDGAYPFFPELGGAILQALIREEPREVVLDQAGIRTVQCGFAAACGRMEILTLYHPVHGVSGDDGRFRIEHVPAGQEVRVTAWHPLFQEASTRVTVRAGETLEVELTIRPNAPPAVSPTPVSPAGASGDTPGDEARPPSEDRTPEGSVF